jgi:hypothetical protein
MNVCETSYRIRGDFETERIGSKYMYADCVPIVPEDLKEYTISISGQSIEKLSIGDLRALSGLLLQTINRYDSNKTKEGEEK